MNGIRLIDELNSQPSRWSSSHRGWHPDILALYIILLNDVNVGSYSVALNDDGSITGHYTFMGATGEVIINEKDNSFTLRPELTIGQQYHLDGLEDLYY